MNKSKMNKKIHKINNNLLKVQQYFFVKIYQIFYMFALKPVVLKMT